MYFHYRQVLEKNAYIDGLEKRLHLLEKSISETIDRISLEPLLEKELKKIFRTNLAYLQMYSESKEDDFFAFIREYFQENGGERVFKVSDDFIGIIENPIQSEKLRAKIPQEIAYIFPIFSTQGFHIGNLILGKKEGKKEYLEDEIEFLKEFSFFIEIHLKYIRTYTLMHEFSVLLDEKVDNKTIAYNNLLNRQKEFIKLISHEVRSPLTSAIFQVESAIEALERKDPKAGELHEELLDLRDQLRRTGSLISKLFSVEYYDNNNVTLFREAIHFPKFLEYEIDLYARVHTEVRFISRIDADIGFVAIDKVQFQQVISNLLDNAVKFAREDDPTVFLSAEVQLEKLIITVEDNGKGFTEFSRKEIFDKYSTGRNKNVGLGLGLYLCKKIISLHGGTITAGNSRVHGGACFTIVFQRYSENDLL